MNRTRPPRPTALAGVAAVLAAAALTVSIATATSHPDPASAFYALPAGIPQIAVGVSCVPGTDHGTATVHVDAHTTALNWAGTLTDTPTAGAATVHRFGEAGSEPNGWTAPYPVTGRGVVKLSSPQSWVAANDFPMPYDCHP